MRFYLAWLSGDSITAILTHSAYEMLILKWC